MTDESNNAPVDLADVIKLVFQVERQKTILGQAMAQMTASNDSLSTTFDWMDDRARADFIQFLMNELHASYESIVLLAQEIVNLQSPSA